MSRSLLLTVSLTLCLVGAVSAEATGGAAAPDEQALLFAKIGGQSITRDEFNAALSRAIRKRYYHGKPPEDELDQVRQQVADEIVTRALLLQEAERRHLSADQAAIQRTLDGYDQRYAGSPRWKVQRESLLAMVRKRLEEDNLISQLEEEVRAVPPPTQKQLRSYYHDHPDKFTEPAQQRVWVILIKVDPSSPADAWSEVLADAEDLVSRLRNGADFAEIANQHSADRSAAQGGDMGYLHQGMLSPAAQKVVDELPIDAVSDPIRLLEGIAIFKVSDRRPVRLRSYEDVVQRARELLMRERSDRAWLAFKHELRSSTPISVYGPTTPDALE